LAIYQYKAINQQGREIKGSVTADGLPQAKQKIQFNGLMIVSISEQKSAQTSQKSKGLGQLVFSKRIKVEDLSLMTRQLATLIKARIPLSESLAALMDQLDHETLRIVISEVRQKINEGSSFALALKDYPKVFNHVYVNMVEAGESSGTLDIVLLRLAEFTEAQVKLKHKVTSSLMYPMIMACAGFVMMVFIFTVIIPKITKIFISMKKELPLSTKICIFISHAIQHYWAPILITIIVSIFFFRKYLKTPSGESKWHRIQLRLPIIGPLIMMINVARFCSTLATLLSSGVPILSALQIVKNLVANIHMQKAVADSRDQVKEGLSLCGPLVQSGLFPSLVTHMIRLGEKSGELEPMLEIVAENYEDQVNAKLDGLTSILEPIMMIALGIVVGLIVISVIVPMMSLNSLRSS
jgi:general secretion pathway protein F